MRNYRDAFAIAALALELDDAIDEREQCPVLTSSDVRTRMDFGTELANKNASSADFLSIVAFDAASLSGGVATVPCGTLTFFMSHLFSSIACGSGAAAPKKMGGSGAAAPKKMAVSQLRR